ncbi:hypothetical protein MKZ38_008516 [Zalerion maritima]|uniref:Uncharacterized protein n=1 Tax=Zalerion maritima TaxID=339359 RepID=A0AAD5RHG3_9PEZI|nr:hypothetical protein MKZ38_008516 [Zalerion maritima]
MSSEYSFAPLPRVGPPSPRENPQWKLMNLAGILAREVRDLFKLLCAYVVTKADISTTSIRDIRSLRRRLARWYRDENFDEEMRDDQLGPWTHALTRHEIVYTLVRLVELLTNSTFTWFHPYCYYTTQSPDANLEVAETIPFGISQSPLPAEVREEVAQFKQRLRDSEPLISQYVLNNPEEGHWGKVDELEDEEFFEYVDGLPTSELTGTLILKEIFRIITGITADLILDCRMVSNGSISGPEEEPAKDLDN